MGASDVPHCGDVQVFTAASGGQVSAYTGVTTLCGLFELRMRTLKKHAFPVEKYCLWSRSLRLVRVSATRPCDSRLGGTGAACDSRYVPGTCLSFRGFSAHLFTRKHLSNVRTGPERVQIVWRSGSVLGTKRSRGQRSQLGCCVVSGTLFPPENSRVSGDSRRVRQ
ncbi:hypothetical protein Bbelb_376160 [Branchiostoma belcheri]|nr:hypothetical protein Bbelb_376160 [Branchiostoma belcheri]